jgi:type II secretory pathway component PulF
MLFKYSATDDKGAGKEGTIDAVNIDIALSSLQRRGYMVTAIDPIAERTSFFEKEFALFEHISNKEVVMFSRQIATLFEAHVSALRIFRLLATEAENPLLRRVLNEISDDIQGGSLISNALAQHPEVFSAFYVSMVKAGEESGKLDEVFLFLADYLDRSYEVMSKARNALIYPAFVIATFVGVMSLMMTMVIPRMAEIIISSGQEVPIYTKIIMAISGFMVNYIGLLILLVVAGGFFLFRFVRTEVGARALDEFRLIIPYVGDLYQKLYLSRIADSLATMLQSGISMISALEIASQVVGNRLYREILENAINDVRGGKPVSDAFADYPQIPGVMVQMIKVGEESGSLASILDTLSKFYRREVNGAVDTLVSLIEPVMIVVLGLGVGILLAAVLIPIYNISTSI